MTVINGADAPSDYSFHVAVPEGGQVAPGADGGFVVLAPDGTPVLEIKAPWARDANDAPVPVTYALDGTTLTMHVDHAGAAYPVVADPAVVLKRKPPKPDPPAKVSHNHGTPPPAPAPAKPQPPARPPDDPADRLPTVHFERCKTFKKLYLGLIRKIEICAEGELKGNENVELDITPDGSKTTLKYGGFHLTDHYALLNDKVWLNDAAHRFSAHAHHSQSGGDDATIEFGGTVLHRTCGRMETGIDVDWGKFVIWTKAHAFESPRGKVDLSVKLEGWFDTAAREKAAQEREYTAGVIVVFRYMEQVDMVVFNPRVAARLAVEEKNGG
jgi:hypothetical protein